MWPGCDGAFEVSGRVSRMVEYVVLLVVKVVACVVPGVRLRHVGSVQLG